LKIQRDEFGAFEPFIELPSRVDYKDYYRVITRPVSLLTLKKRVKGVHGKNAATGVSDFKSWAAFEEEVSTIWKNAYLYNEDGSDIFLLAKELQVSSNVPQMFCQLLTFFRISSPKSSRKPRKPYLSQLARKLS